MARFQDSSGITYESCKKWFGRYMQCVVPHLFGDLPLPGFGSSASDTKHESLTGEAANEYLKKLKSHSVGLQGGICRVAKDKSHLTRPCLKQDSSALFSNKILLDLRNFFSFYRKDIFFQIICFCRGALAHDCFITAGG
jgi:hypothetical protein